MTTVYLASFPHPLLHSYVYTAAAITAVFKWNQEETVSASLVPMPARHFCHLQYEVTAFFLLHEDCNCPHPHKSFPFFNPYMYMSCMGENALHVGSS